jgi:GxxExxY protein
VGSPQIAPINADSEVNKDPQTYALIGAAMEVHKHLGHGFLETVYQEALAFELAARGIPFHREVTIPVRYKNHLLQCGYRADFVCFESIILELNAISQLTGADEAQTINALKATGLQRALLINFGASSLDYKRLVFNLRESAQSAYNTKDLNLTGVQLG